MSTQGLTVNEANSFLALEPHLVDLLRQAVAGMSPGVHVFTAADLADVKQGTQKTPAIHLVYGGYRVSADNGASWELEHTWLAVVAVRNVAEVRSGKAARQDAGALVSRVMFALAGARVTGAVRPLALISPPLAGYSGGHQYIPSAFRATTVFRKP